MGKLHELLAVEPELKGEAQSTLNRLQGLFTDAQDRFMGMFRAYKPMEEGGEYYPPEVKQVATTVDEQLNYLRDAMGKYIDAAVQKETTNTEAFAELEIDDEIMELPATALLNLEARLAEIKRVIETIPVLDPAVKWQFDEDFQVYVTDETVTFKTKKVPRAHVLYEATEEHPAQVEQYYEDVRIGEWHQVTQAGAIPYAEKRGYMKRVDELLRKVKRARQQANDIEAVSVEVADMLFDYIFAE